jgi:hypothetical protein
MVIRYILVSYTQTNHFPCDVSHRAVKQDEPIYDNLIFDLLLGPHLHKHVCPVLRRIGGMGRVLLWTTHILLAYITDWLVTQSFDYVIMSET